MFKGSNGDCNAAGCNNVRVEPKTPEPPSIDEASPHEKAFIKRIQASDRHSAALPIVATAQEVLHWCERSRVESWSRKQNPKSLYDDARASARSIGPELGLLVGVELEAFAAAAKAVVELKRHEASTVRILSSACAGLLQALLSPDATRSAWRDFVAVTIGTDADSTISADRMTILSSLIQSSGRSASSIIGGARVITEGGEQAQHFRLGNPTFGEENLEARIAAAGEYLASPAEKGHCIVWLTFANADISAGKEFGRMTFFPIDWAVPNARDADGQVFPHREELRTLLEERHWRLPAMDSDRPYQVLVRVDLGVRTSYKAIEDAENLVQTLVRVAMNRSGGSAWKRCGSAFCLMNGLVAVTAISARPFRGPDNFGRNATSEELEMRAGQVAQALGSSSLTPELADAIRLFSEAAEVDSREVALNRRKTIDRRTVILLEDASYEHSAAYLGVAAEHLESLVMGDWAFNEWAGRVLWAVETCLDSPGHQQGNLRQRVFSYSQGSELFSLESALPMRDELLSLCTDPLDHDLAARYLGSLDDAGLCSSILEDLDSDCNVLKARLHRCRNALAHGNPVIDEVVASVRGVSRFRANAVLTICLEYFSSGASDPRAAMSSITESQDRFAAFLDAGARPVDFWKG